MKIKHFLLILLVLFFTLSCYGNQIENKILLNYEKITNSWNIVSETKVYDEISHKRIIVNIIKKSKSDIYLYDSIVNVVFEDYKNNYQLNAFVVQNFQEMTRMLFDKNKNLKSKRKIVSEEFYTEDKKKVNEAAYMENSYMVPFLGKKYLKKMSFSSSKNIYFNNSLRIKKGFSLALDLNESIGAKLVFNDNIIEFYQDQFGNKIYRFLDKIDDIDITNLNEIEKYAKAKVDSIEELKAKINRYGEGE